MTEETILGSRGSEVRNETVTNVLVGVGALKRSVVKILRGADESGEGAIVRGVREGVVGAQAKIFAESLDHLESEPVIDRIARVVRVVQQAGIVVSGAALRQT